MEHKILKIDIASSVHPLGGAPVGRASEYPASAGMDKHFVISAANDIQALLCLNNLISAEADDAAKVRAYAHLVAERLQALGKLMRPMLWSPTYEAP